MNEQPFISSDLSLVAAILSTKKARLVRYETVSPSKVAFHLTPASVCFELQRDYINDSLTVSAKTIADNVKTLKHIIQGRGNI